MNECENVENGFSVCPLVTELQAENANLLDILKRLMSEFDEPDEYMTVFQEAQVALEGKNNENKT
jgi:hypothetical protein